MLTLAGRGRPSLTTALGTVVSTTSLTGGRAGNRGDPAVGVVGRRAAGCVDWVRELPQEPTSAAAVTRTTYVASARPVISPGYGGDHRGASAHVDPDRCLGSASEPGATLLHVWSLWSENSVLSICSQDSVLSIGSAASFASFASVGSFASAGSIGSAMSAAALLSYQSAGSVMSHQSTGSVLSSQADHAFLNRRARGRIPAGAVGAGVLAVLVGVAVHRARR
jgi:hypothetical protein